MKLTIHRSPLLKSLQLMSGVVERRQTLPILSNVLLVATEDNILSITATDLEIELIDRAPAQQVTEPGKITVSARKLLDICRTLPEDAVIQMILEGSQLLIRAGESRFTLATLPAQDFPNIEEGKFTTQFKISQASFRKIIGRVYFAMGQQDVRHYLNGALFDIDQGVMKCVATDGHRLAYSSINNIDSGNTKSKIILPRKSVLELIRLLNAEDETEVTVQMGENHFRVASPSFVFTSKLINAQYPDYSKLIPRNIQNTAMMSREALRQALTRASILSDEKIRGIRFQLNNNQLRIMANNLEQEEAEEVVSLEYQGNGMEIGFNATYLLDVVSTIPSENLHWSFADPNSGVLIKAFDTDDSLYVVMPMRL